MSSVSPTGSRIRSNRMTMPPLWLQVLLAASAGTGIGALFGTTPIIGNFSCRTLGELGQVVVTMLRALAVPLVLFAILEAFVKTHVSWRQGGWLVLFCMINVSVAMVLGLLIMNGLEPGQSWQRLLGAAQLVAASTVPDPQQPAKGKTPIEKEPALAEKDQLPADKPASATSPELKRRADEILSQSKKGTLDPVKNLVSYVPRSIVSPFLENNVISVVLIGVVLGCAVRRVVHHQSETGETSAHVVAQFIEGSYQILVQVLDWVVKLVPLAVFGVLAQSVGEFGLNVFRDLMIFLLTLLAGLGIHALVYYPAIAWLIGGKSPRVYLGDGGDAILTALSCNSSLATVPVTLRSLSKMRVSPESARMAACVGTNLNNDGVTLYEAMAAIFVAQAVGISLGFSQQLTIVLASIMAGMGIVGIPEVGLIVLPLVLGAAGLSDATIAQAIPLIMTVDWVIARCRSAVNVMSDMLIAILLDATSSSQRSAAVISPPPLPSASTSPAPHTAAESHFAE